MDEHHQTNRHVQLLLACTLILACGATNTGTGSSPTFDAGSGPIAIEQLGDAFATAACRTLFRCTTLTSDLALTRALFTSESVCITAFRRSGITEDLADLQRAVSAGTVRYDANAARACINRLGTTCAISGVVGDFCRGVFTGTVPVGAMCHRSEECADDSWCDHGDFSMRMCPGHCAARTPIGMQCTSSRQCSRASSGDVLCQLGADRTAPAVCVELRTGSDASEGQPCGRVMTSATVYTETACAAGLTCFFNRCVRTVPVGAICTVGTPCATGSICLPNAMGRNVCTVLEGRTTEGATCQMFGRGTQFCSPVANLVCESGTCRRIGSGAVGSSCMNGDFFDLFSCNEGLYCERSSQTCRSRLAAGAACKSDLECQSRSCIDRRCAERRCD